MTRECCTAGGLGRATAAALPGASLLLLPKCPLCFAAWLTVATGLHFSASGAMWLRIAVVSAAVVPIAATMVRLLRPQPRQ